MMGDEPYAISYIEDGGGNEAIGRLALFPSIFKFTVGCRRMERSGGWIGWWDPGSAAGFVFLKSCLPND